MAAALVLLGLLGLVTADLAVATATSGAVSEVKKDYSFKQTALDYGFVTSTVKIVTKWGGGINRGLLKAVKKFTKHLRQLRVDANELYQAMLLGQSRKNALKLEVKYDGFIEMASELLHDAVKLDAEFRDKAGLFEVCNQTD